MRLILAEKPSVAKDIAAAFSGAKRQNGYFETGDTVITWGVGHLLELKEPEDYDETLKRWDVSRLPIIPPRFSYKPIARSESQLATIQKLFRVKKPSEVVLATDADREGELLGRLILAACGWRGPLKRFWTSEALTPAVVKKTLGSLKPGADFDGLYQEALARQHADWLIGINETRAMTVTASGRKLLSIGRVQTAVLCALANRERSITDFKPETFWTLCGLYSATRFNLIDSAALAKIASIGEDASPDEGKRTGGNSVFRFKKKEDAERVLGEIRTARQATVLKVEKKDIKEPPPLLFCLSDLQREANKFYGMSAKETLDAAQSLYETHKMLSYPRTSCCHLATSTIGLAESSMRALGHSIDVKKAGRHVFNDKKVGEAGHHALMPLRTKSVAGKPLSAKEQKVFDLVVGRFVAAFHGPHVYAKTEAWLRAAEYDLYASARQTVTPGWHAYYPPGWKPLAETSPAVMTAKKGDVLPLDRADLNEGKTSPPPRFTEASLLSMMKNAWRYAEAPDIREALKDAQGIGTEATRAAVIEVLKNRKYVETKGKSFGVTGLGMAIANAAKKMDLVASDIGFTGIWENKLSGISKGVSSYESFVAEVKALVAKEIDKIRASASSLSTAVGGASAGDLKCPSCESAMRVNRGGAFCSDEKGCGVKIWRKHFSKELTDSQLKQIVQKGKVFVKGFTSKAGKNFDGWLVFDNKYGARLDFSLPPPKSATKKKAGGVRAAPANRAYATRGRRSPS